MEAEVRGWVDKGLLPGVTVAVVSPQGVWSFAAGVDGDDTALHPDSGMALASITKTFTAAEAMLLAERGQLDLDLPASTYLDQPLLCRERSTRSRSSPPGSVARVTPRGAITEFPVCDACVTNDIVEGPGGILYVSDNDGQLRRIRTSGEVLTSISPCGEVFCDPLEGVGSDSTSIWFADFFNARVGRFDVFAAPGADPFTYFAAPGVRGVAVAPEGTVWFTGSAAVGEIDPAVGVVSTTPLSAEGTRITVAANGTVWVTEIFADLIARLTPAASGPHDLMEFPTPVGANPLDIAAAPDGNVWFTQNLRGNVARVTQEGVVTEASKAIVVADPKRPDPVGIAIGTSGQTWYAESLIDKVANVQPR